MFLEYEIFQRGNQIYLFVRTLLIEKAVPIRFVAQGIRGRANIRAERVELEVHMDLPRGQHAFLFRRKTYNYAEIDN